MLCLEAWNSSEPKLIANTMQPQTLVLRKAVMLIFAQKSFQCCQYPTCSCRSEQASQELSMCELCFQSGPQTKSRDSSVGGAVTQWWKRNAKSAWRKYIYIYIRRKYIYIYVHLNQSCTYLKLVYLCSISNITASNVLCSKISLFWNSTTTIISAETQLRYCDWVRSVDILQDTIRCAWKEAWFSPTNAKSNTHNEFEGNPGDCKTQDARVFLRDLSCRQSCSEVWRFEPYSSLGDAPKCASKQPFWLIAAHWGEFWRLEQFHRTHSITCSMVSVFNIEILKYLEHMFLQFWAKESR